MGYVQDDGRGPHADYGKQKRGTFRIFLLGTSLIQKKAATYSPALHCSTIGDDGLNFSVRDGKRWNTVAITTKNIFFYS